MHAVRVFVDKVVCKQHQDDSRLYAMVFLRPQLKIGDASTDRDLLNLRFGGVEKAWDTSDLHSRLR